ncbi:hypothetical protein BKA59DRAFT_278240 [Fusarium tricinctum]|uniref:Uncharacterized protein n=1 Tax=Fusarium tricinctum TaxID=61284 RepID=A0A8K0RMD9_9HYPO|nr:hypothetical protein BKA59DRAFT_278240 [Fusarium tricinctum]
MPSNIFLSMAVGLIGLSSVAAGPCKPLSSANPLTSSATEILSASTVESVAIEASTATESLVSDTVTSTVIAATTTDLSLTLSTTATSADTTTLLTTEISADTTVLTATLTLPETTTLETTTATSEAPAGPTGFFIVAGPGAALGKKLETSEFTGGPVIFDANRAAVFEPRRFVLDESTGRLQRNGMSLCALFNYYNKNVATITQCDTESYYYGTSYLTCGQSATPGSTLRCSMVRLDCVSRGPSGQACTEVTEPGTAWNGQFYTDTLDGESYLSVGVDNLGGRYSPVDLFVDFVVTEN